MSLLETKGAELGIYFDATDLMLREFPEPRWAVEGLIPEGLTMLVGSPKLGKSWMCLGLALAVASGGRALGKIKVDRGDALYCALEDTPRRLQERLGRLLGSEPPPAGLSFVTVLPNMVEAIELLDGWADSHPSARLVVIDVLRKIRPPSDARSSMYEADYDFMGTLKRFADKRGIAVVVVHHTRKSVDEGDVFNEASGSTGLTGAADAILIAKKARNTAEAVLHVTGRDIREGAHALSWDQEACVWVLLDEPVSVLEQSAARRRISEYLSGFPGSSPLEIAKALDIGHDAVKQTLRRMVRDDQLDSDGEGHYFPPAPPVDPVTPVTPVTQPSDSGDRSDTPLWGVA